MEKGLTFTGARARFSVNGKKVGWATGCSGSEEVIYEPVEVLDNVEVEEYVPLGYRVTFQASFVRLVGKTPKGEGFFPKIGGNSEEHLHNILTNGSLSCMIEDTGTTPNRIIAQLEQVKVQSHNWSINARGIVAHDMTFNAIRMKDETEV